MTRKQALMRVCGMLDTYEQTEETREIQEKLCEIMEEMPFASWSERTIFDTIDQWIIEHGKIPNTRELAKKGLPPVPVIRNRFKMNAREFLDKHYPRPEKLCYSATYGNKTANEWLESFKIQYDTINPRSAEEYNKRRDAYMPSWFTVARICDVQKWSELLELCGIYTSSFLPNNFGRRGEKKEYIVNHTSDYEQELERIDKKYGYVDGVYIGGV